MTAVEWLIDKLMKGEFINSTNELIEQAKQMEKEEKDKIYDHAFEYGQLSAPELSDDDIYEMAYDELHPMIRNVCINTFMDGAKAYREKIKKTK